MIVWDLGGVVAHFHPDRRLAALEAATGLPGAVIHNALWGSGLDAAAERGELHPDDVWARSLQALDARTDRDGLRHCWAEAFEPNWWVLELVDEIGEPAALLSNNGPILDACLTHELSAIGSRFDHLLLSWRLRATKPSPEAYLRVAVLLNTPPRELTLIDDQQANVDAARRAGWSAVRYRDPADLRRHLLDGPRVGAPQGDSSSRTQHRTLRRNS